MRLAAVLAGVLAVLVYVLPGLLAPAANWPLWDVRVYWWGGQQAAVGGGALYAPGAPLSFTYPPFAALLFAAGADASVGVLKAALTAGTLAAWRCCAGCRWARPGCGSGPGPSSRCRRWPC